MLLLPTLLLSLLAAAGSKSVNDLFQYILLPRRGAKATDTKKLDASFGSAGLNCRTMAFSKQCP